ncbi:hypothetical protein BGZ96_007326 [Linnemannia gamsii]|uniref:F-box domain-containing protein n=1 Tax=Linnemannia gamsii TaxID=64522 RepID=A0ABQ7K0I3_9FUNG|nr:hypothetical protein BGZ96_007326 [Linnemannia gamsii]
MPSTFPLPLECLDIILRLIASQRETAHLLARLLRVNKYVCNATLPILYKNPFENINFRYGLPSARIEMVEIAFRRLALTLLLSIPLEDSQHHNPALTDILRAAYFPTREPVPDLRRPFIPYHSFITDVVITVADTASVHDIPFHGPLLATFPNYIEHLSQPQVRETVAAAAQTGSLIISGKLIEYFRPAGHILRKDFTWILCTTNAEHIRSVVIPLSDILRYFSLIGRFKTLSNITFSFNPRLQLNERMRSRLSPQQLQILDRQMNDQTQHLDEMIRFVQELRQRHPHILRVAACTSPGNHRDVFPENYQAQLLQCLPPLNSPSFVNKDNWLQFIAKIQETNLSRIKVLLQERPFCDVNHLKRLAQREAFLHQCRSLDSIHISSWSEDLFQWAVDERRNGLLGIAAGRKPTTPPPVPLRIANINYGPKSDGRQVDDLMFGFSETLESLDITSDVYQHYVIPIHDDLLPDFKVGSRGGDVALYCELARLTRFTISTSEHLLRIESSFLCRLPSLEYLVLKDTRKTYSVNGVTYWSPTLGTLPRLAHIALEGTPAISFHPDALHHTPNLAHLHLGLLAAPTSHIFIPPAEDLDNVGQVEDGAVSQISTPTPIPTLQQPTRPIWVWDWELRKLETLKLNSAFAYKFQFRMLEKTPNLKVLSLNIHTYARQHARTIYLNDLRLVSTSMAATTLVSSPPADTVVP